MGNQSNNILIRADASWRIGSGHVMRTLALGQMLQDTGWKVHYVSYNLDDTLLSRLQKEGFQYHPVLQKESWESNRDASQVVEIANQFKIRWIITDGYHFGTEYQRKLKQAGLSLMCIDDIAACHYVADIVLNQNMHAKPELYSAEKYTSFFLGPQYSLLRKNIRKAGESFVRQIRPEVSRILITMGGADTPNATLKVLKALHSLEENRYQIRIILGALNRHRPVLQNFLKKSHIQAEILYNLDEELPDCFAWADFAVTASGSILWEYALFATPLLTLILAENQAPLCEELERKQCVFNAGWFDRITDQELREKIYHVCENMQLRQTLSRNIRKVVGTHQNFAQLLRKFKY